MNQNKYAKSSQTYIKELGLEGELADNVNIAMQAYAQWFIDFNKKELEFVVGKLNKLEETIEWHKNGMPDYDGPYLVLIHEKQDCGNVWRFYKVIECFMNQWCVSNLFLNSFKPL